MSQCCMILEVHSPLSFPLLYLWVRCSLVVWAWSSEALVWDLSPCPSTTFMSNQCTGFFPVAVWFQFPIDDIEFHGKWYSWGKNLLPSWGCWGPFLDSGQDNLAQHYPVFAVSVLTKPISRPVKSNCLILCLLLFYQMMYFHWIMNQQTTLQKRLRDMAEKSPTSAVTLLLACEMLILTQKGDPSWSKYFSDVKEGKRKQFFFLE